MARKLKVDFTGVESFVKADEGEHIVQLKEIEEKTSSGGNEMLAVKFEVVAGRSTGATLYDNFVLTEKALWKLKSYLEIVGMKAEGKVALDIDKLIGKKCIVNVIHEEYNGATQARIADFKKLESKPDPVEDDEEWEDDEEEEETPPPKKKSKKPAPKPEPEEDEDDEDEEEEEDEPTPPKKAKKPAKPAPKTKKKPAPVEEEDEDDDDDEWEEE